MVMVLNGCTWVPLQHPLALVAFLSFVASTMGPPCRCAGGGGFFVSIGNTTSHNLQVNITHEGNWY